MTRPGYQANMLMFQHVYVKNRIHHKRFNEIIHYNDCLYRNMYRYEHVVLLDIDEVIMPLQHVNWSEMAKNISRQALLYRNRRWSAYNFQNIYFMHDMLKAHEPDGYFKAKSFYDKFKYCVQAYRVSKKVCGTLFLKNKFIIESNQKHCSRRNYV